MNYIHTCKNPPFYSSKLAMIFKSEKETSDDKWVIHFSLPYKQIIQCEILPRNEFPAPIIYYLNFRYNENGEIYQFVFGPAAGL